jgi:hypothetical protein
MHPEWVKFAQSVKDVVRVGAINADQYKEVAGQFGVQGFPTVKYWKMGAKNNQKPNDYSGQRTQSALHSTAVGLITHSVVTATSLDTITKELGKASLHKAVVLFSSKSKPPPIFSVLSQSPHFEKKLGFVLVMEKTAKICEAFGVTKFPTILIAENLAEGSEAPANGLPFNVVPYDGGMDYKTIAKYLQGVTGVAAEGDAEEAKADASAEKKETKSKTEKEKKPEVKKEPPKPAHPVRPVELTADNFQTFCSPGAVKMHGQQPFCLVSLGTTLDLSSIHAQFEHEAVLFFYAPDEKAAAWAEDLSDGLGPHAPLAPGDVVILRASKGQVKFVTWRANSSGMREKTDTLSAFLARAVGGETTFERSPGFPKLRS